jgi:hypothetical protein
MAILRLAAMFLVAACTIEEPEPAFHASCNGIANTGCDFGEKCTWTPISRRMGCFVDGDRLEGESCEFSSFTLTDDCVGRHYCWNGVCTEICDVLGETNCDEDEVCRSGGHFTDAENTGVCMDEANLGIPWWEL